MAIIDWIHGDLLGLSFPAHAHALKTGGTDFLTDAFRAAGLIHFIENSERARSQLLIMVNFLNLWERVDMGGVIDYLSAKG